MHVDGAYGGAALAAPSVRHLFAGIEHADSFIVDPHKWLFAPVRLLRAGLPRPGDRPAAPTPSTPATSTRSTSRREWNPSDYARAPVPARPRPAVLVLAGRPRHRRLPRRDRVRRWRVARAAAEEIRNRPVPRAAGRAGAVGADLPPHRLGRRRLRRMEQRGCWRRATPSSRRPPTAASRAPGLRSSTRARPCPTSTGILATMA